MGSLIRELPAHEKVSQLVDWQGSPLSLSRQSKLLNIARSSLYYDPVPVDSETLRLLDLLDLIYTKLPYYGSRRLAYELSKAAGYPVNRKRVSSLMSQLGLVAVYPKPNLSKNDTQDKRFPYLLRGLPITHPNHVWGTDITYIRLGQGFVYLTAMIDWYSRYIISWEVSTTLETEFCLIAGKAALTVATPEIINSDQGVQYTSQEYIGMWDQTITRISMDGRGRCLDNIFTERFWRTIKYEEVYLKSYANVQEARLEIGKYVEHYNNERPHQSLNNYTPATVYRCEKKGETILI